MNWRQWIGLTPTQANLAHDLLRAARQSGQTGWVYDAADCVISLANIHREYAQESPRYCRRPTSSPSYGTSKPPARPPWCRGPTPHALSATASNPPPKIHRAYA
jgi:hypothetical protein